MITKNLSGQQLDIADQKQAIMPKSIADQQLNITDRTRRRICQRYRMWFEALPGGYSSSSKFLSKKAYEYLEFIVNQNRREKTLRKFPKNSVSKMLNICPKTLSNWLQNPRILQNLLAIGYKKTQKFFTQEQFLLIKDYFDITDETQIELDEDEININKLINIINSQKRSFISDKSTAKEVSKAIFDKFGNEGLGYFLKLCKHSKIDPVSAIKIYRENKETTQKTQIQQLFYLAEIAGIKINK